VEIGKPAKHVPQEREKNSKRPCFAQGSPAAAEGSKLQTGFQYGLSATELPTSRNSWFPTSKSFSYLMLHFFP